MAGLKPPFQSAILATQRKGNAMHVLPGNSVSFRSRLILPAQAFQSAYSFPSSTNSDRNLQSALPDIWDLLL